MCTKSFGLHVIVAKKKIYSYIHVGKITYLQDISSLHVFPGGKRGRCLGLTT
jgi:hypothetical protein